MSDVKTISVTIPANEAVSSTADLGSSSLVAIEMPETWAGTSITFQSKAKVTEDVDGGPALEDLDNVYDSGGNEITWTVAANRVVVPTAAHESAMAPLRYLRIRSGTSAAPVGQNPAKIIRLLVKNR